ncbi:hypothetical protein KOAAANKH_02104 [Brevundimonas sp. NIBR10]|uniref:HEAT repeat domain-containing protein n=1 Tax=Brevundimonas sp. NIBR10 TaxID=3015997 RepID=UPI0022F1A253|nr:HEAT repeat domain-containing protein [Brevundimonas sp. NIBR10]WGM47229.1 hypothetical protein KOAAANKH_02104 [Brevundimonas sp. NIBR10]
MTLLASLWWGSLALALSALVWMFGLVLARLGRERSGRARDLDRKRLREVCLAIVSEAGETAEGLRPFQHRARLMAEALLEFGAIVRGAERERLIAAYRLMAADSRFRERLFAGSKAGRLAAAEALALFPSDETERALNRVVNDPRDAELAAAAVRSLVELDRPPPLGRLLDELEARKMTDSLVYLPIVRRLVALSPDEAMSRLDSSATSPAARVLLADAVAVSGDYRAVAPLQRAARADRPDLRMAAIRGLSLLAHPASIPTLTEALSDPDWEVRAAACEAMGRTGFGEGVADLAELLADSVWWVRFQAAEALGRLGPDGLEALLHASRLSDDLPRRAASLALAEKGFAAPVLERGSC